VAAGTLGAEDRPAHLLGLAVGLARSPAGLGQDALLVELLDLGDQDAVREHVVVDQERLAGAFAQPLIAAEEGEPGHHQHPQRPRRGQQEDRAEHQRRGQRPEQEAAGVGEGDQRGGVTQEQAAHRLRQRTLPPAIAAVGQQHAGHEPPS
jgi:hypothetical protein